MKVSVSRAWVGIVAALFAAAALYERFGPIDRPGTLRLVIEFDTRDSALADTTALVDRTIALIRMRIDEYGVRDAVFDRDRDGRLIVSLPGVYEPDRVKAVIENRGILEFRLADSRGQFAGALGDIDAALRRAGVSVERRGTSPPRLSPQELLDVGPDSAPHRVDVDAVFSQFLIGSPQPGEYFVAVEDSARVDSLIRLPDLQRAMPEGIDLFWSAETPQEALRSYNALYALESRPIVSNAALVDAQAQLDPVTEEVVVNFELTRLGGRIFEQATTDHVGEYLAIVLDGSVRGRPPVIRGPISRRGRIEVGGDRFEEAVDLALILRVTPLPISIKIVEERFSNR